MKQFLNEQAPDPRLQEDWNRQRCTATVIRGGIAGDLSDPFRLRRVAVRGTNDLLDFRLALTRGRSRL